MLLLSITYLRRFMSLRRHCWSCDQQQVDAFIEYHLLAPLYEPCDQQQVDALLIITYLRRFIAL